MNAVITVVSLGTGDPELMNLKTVAALRKAGSVFLRTARHPAAPWLTEQGIIYTSLDDLYIEADDFDSLYRGMAETLWKSAADRPIVYAVPDPLTDLSVDQLFLLRPEGASLSLIPGVSTSDTVLSAVRFAVLGSGLRISAASSLRDNSAAYDPDLSLLVTEADSAILAGEIKIVLSSLLEDETEILYLPDLNHPDPRKIPLFEMDRQPVYSHLTSFFIPGAGYRDRSRFTLQDLEKIMTRLRAPDGCPWDRQQTHASLRPYLIEEAWEAVNAIDEGDPDHLADELGDVLFQVVFHASIGSDFDEFTMRDILSAICGKMLRRHPHVFGDRHFASAGEVADAWEKLKRDENGGTTIGDSLNSVSNALPSLRYAMKIKRKTRQLPGLQRTAAALSEELRRLCGTVQEGGNRISEAKMGQLLLTCAELCELCGADGELLLHQAADRWKQQYQRMEKLILSEGKSPESLTFRDLCVYLKHVEERN